MMSASTTRISPHSAPSDHEQLRLGSVERVSYRIEDWGLTPRRITVDGRLVRLAGYRSQHPATIDVLSAGHRANTDGIDALLLTRADGSAGADEVAQPRWDLDGGSATMRSSGSRLVRTPNS